MHEILLIESKKRNLKCIALIWKHALHLPKVFKIIALNSNLRKNLPIMERLKW